MRIVLTNFGTMGDVQPFVALAIELREHGHETLLAYSPGHRRHIERNGLVFVPVGPDLSDQQREINRAWTDGSGDEYSNGRMRSLLGSVLHALPETYSTLCEICSDADVLIAGPAQPAARMVHETTGIPFVAVQLSHFGGIGSPALRAAACDLINPFRQRLGLEALTDPLTVDANSPQLTLYAMSPRIAPVPRRWPDHWHMTGFFFQRPPAAAPDEKVGEFLSCGEPPVVISFGSMSHDDPAGLQSTLTDAVRRAGVRAVIQDPCLRSEPCLKDSQVFLTSFVDHGWLFPRASCIVQHGGAGTAGAVFRSGVPGIFVPHGTFYDQPYWARLARDLGCSGPAIPFPELTSENLAEAIRETQRNEPMRQSAHRLGELIRTETGVANARRLIASLVAALNEKSWTSSHPRDLPKRLPRHPRTRSYARKSVGV
jgi:sterol 3beta-glucosyltransferase